MKRLLLPLLAVLALPAQASVDPEVHKLCLPAADYLGCIKAQTTKTTDIPTLRVVEGKTELTGNSCPSGFAYAGAGNCRNVLSEDPSFNLYDLDHIGLLAAGFTPKPYMFGVTGRLFFGKTIVKAVDDPSCPSRQPYLYTNSSCDSQPKAPPIKEIRRVIKRIPKGQRDIDKWNKQLFKLFREEGLASKAMNYSTTSKSNIPSPMDLD